MQKPGRQLSIVSVFLIVIPWSIVALTYAAYRFAAKPVLFDQRDALEIRGLSNAMEAYKINYGEYPPDFSSGNVRLEIDQHLAKIFPDRLSEFDIPDSISKLGPQNALHFWLQGFSTDPEHPLTGEERGSSPFYRFTIMRFSGDDYYPRAGKAPYVYFRADTYKVATFDALPQCGTARPYLTVEASSGDPVFACPDSFQIICAGTDGNYGRQRMIGSNMEFGAHVDNLTNFVDGPLGNAAVTYRRRQLRKTCELGIFTAVICLASSPFVLLLRQKRDGIQVLRRLVREQSSAEPYSEVWQNILLINRRQQKSQAVRRMMVVKTES